MIRCTTSALDATRNGKLVGLLVFSIAQIIHCPGALLCCSIRIDSYNWVAIIDGSFEIYLKQTSRSNKSGERKVII
jgi:hypothetical protein